MDSLTRLERSGVVPVVVLENAADAVPTAKALVAGGIDVMEITFRTAAAEASIRAVAEGCPEMLVGAGTVITLEQCKTAVAAGAKFIVSPGFNPKVVAWCVEQGVAVTPGCVTPTEITAALEYGLRVLKFFPAGVFGGLSAMKALSAPFGGVRFIPTGGVNAQNLAEYISAPFVHAVGGSWVCSKQDIAAGNFEKITTLSRQAAETVLGFEVVHIGLNAADAAGAQQLSALFGSAFSFEAKDGNSSVFASPKIEIMKGAGRGERGHIAVRTNAMPCAVAALEKRGFTIDPDSVKMKDGRMTLAYLRQEFGGFAVHLLQK